MAAFAWHFKASCFIIVFLLDPLAALLTSVVKIPSFVIYLVLLNPWPPAHFNRFFLGRNFCTRQTVTKNLLEDMLCRNRILASVAFGRWEDHWDSKKKSHGLNALNSLWWLKCLCWSLIESRWQWEVVGRGSIHDLDERRFSPCNNWMKSRTCCLRGSEGTPDTPLKFWRAADAAIRDVVNNVWLHSAVKPRLSCLWVH